MIPIPLDQVTELPIMDIEHDASYGIFDDGVLIHYVMKDRAVLVEWKDIIELGMQENLENSKIAAEPTEPEIRQIERPVIP